MKAAAFNIKKGNTKMATHIKSGKAGMKNHTKYSVGYFMPPEESYNWVRKDQDCNCALQGAFGLWMGKEYSFSCGSEFSGNPGKKKFCESAGGCVLYKSGRGKG